MAEYPHSDEKKGIRLPSGPLPEWQKPRLQVSMVKSLYNNKTRDDGPLILALSKMRQAKREGRPVTNTVVMHYGKEVDLGPLLLKIERRAAESELVQASEKPSLEAMALQFEKAKQERREKGCEDVQQDKREEFALEHEKMKRAQGGEQSVIVPPEKREFIQGKCIKGEPLDPYCNCSPLTCSGKSNKLFLPPPIGAVEEFTDHYLPIWLDYIRQLRQTHCFDIDVHPGSSIGAGVSPCDFNKDAELLMELANRAIQEYNERECNVFKYKVIKIEKVNFTMTAYLEYWMTVKVLNLTLGTPIETFQIHAGKSCFNGDVKFIYCCQPKEEAVVGLANCELCLGKLRGEACQEGKEKAVVGLANCELCLGKLRGEACQEGKEKAVVGLAKCELCLGKLRGEACQEGKEKALEV